MIDLNIIIFIGLSFFILFLFFYILKREKVIEQKFAAMELSLEELNKEVFLLKKELKNNNSIESIKKMEKIIEEMLSNIEFLEEKNKEFYSAIEEELSKLHVEIKKSHLPNVTSINKHEEEKILSLYKNGYSVEEISRELRIPAGEIELILKFSNIL
jgi:hypothetical protein